MQASPHRATTTPDRSPHASTKVLPAARRGPELGTLTPEEIRRIVLEILG